MKRSFLYFFKGLIITVVLCSPVRIAQGSNASHFQEYDRQTETVNAQVISSAIAISTGFYHTCAVISTGGVKCWGRNDVGQLGNASTVGSLTPVDVEGLNSGVISISTGLLHTCAITVGGGIHCWGSNTYGQLGDLSYWDSTTPVDVVGLTSGVTAISTGDYHTCALTNLGGVKCWGRNTYGQLGNGSTENSITPVDVTGLTSQVIAVSSGDYHTCALTSSGEVKCWGRNIYRQLGDGTTTDRLTPVNVLGLTGMVSTISAGGYHNCALTTGGGVKCWGDDFHGQLGDGTTEISSTPVDVVGLSSGVIAINSGGYHTCVVTSEGGIKCWGENYFGQLGDGTTLHRLVPVQVLGMSSEVAIVDAGGGHTCAIATTGRVKCWGYNYFGQLGDGTNTRIINPVDVEGLTSEVAQIDAGYRHTCALTTAGGVKCLGWNYYGQLGDGTTMDRYALVDVVGLSSGVTSISAGSFHTCALMSSGGVKCWGNNSYGQLGDKSTTDRLTPVDVFGLSSGVVAVSAGGYGTCVLTDVGGVKCWGLYSGNGMPEKALTPYDALGLTREVVYVSSGSYHSCAVTTGGGVKCWGNNSDGALGTGTYDNSYVPVDVFGLSSGMASVYAGDHHTCALTTEGGIKCWGENYFGQLGDGSSATRLTPVNTGGLSTGVVSVSLGEMHTCVLLSTSGVKCWGYNFNGQLGINSTMDMLFPMDVVGLSNGVVGVTAGSIHTCVLTAAGGVKCWGDNNWGQLSAKVLWTPVDVIGFEVDSIIYLPMISHP